MFGCHFIPILAKINKKDYDWIYPEENWKKLELKNIQKSDFKVAEHLFLLNLKQIK